MSSSPLNPTAAVKTTIWIWPTGLFPRRIIYYLRAKHITLSALTSANIHLLPVVLDSSGKLVTKNGFEERPSGTSLPVMRIEYRDGTTTWVHESLAIIAWLEEIFPEQGCGDILGNTREQRARTRDVLSVLGDAIVWGSCAAIHSDHNTLSWSGLTMSTMSTAAAADANKRFHNLLGKIEAWCEKDVVREESRSLSGKGSAVTLADVAIMASVAYAQDMYGKDWVAEHGVLRVWCEKVKGEEWYVGWDGLKGAEEREWKAALGQ